MTFPLFDSLATTSAVTYGFAGIVVLIIASKLAQPSKLDAIPTVGPSSWIGSWWYAFKVLRNSMNAVQEGYEKYKSKPFKVPTLGYWMVVISSREHIEEVRKAPDDVLSLSEAIHQRVQTEYTMGAELRHNPYHVPIVRSRLARNLGSLCPAIKDEIMAAFDDILDLKGNEWKSVPGSDSVCKVICRTTNRVFVGLPLCRNSDWMKLSLNYTHDVLGARIIISLFPRPLKSMATRLFSNVGRSKQLGRKLLGPLIEERRRFLNDSGDQGTDKPDDFLLWLMENAEGPELTTEYLTNRMLAVNFSAIHTSSQTFTHALFYLVANPQYIQPLREEVEGIVEKEGWTTTALGNMRKLDSFLRECQRFEGIACVGFQRLALKDFTFSDGTFIPKGTTLAAPLQSIQNDEAFYENAGVFEPFRFAGLDQDAAGPQYVTTQPEFLPFGHGKHACPGRFFAVMVLKAMLAHIVVTYDVKLDENAPLPRSRRIMTASVADPSAKVMFRRRVD